MRGLLLKGFALLCLLTNQSFGEICYEMLCFQHQTAREVARLDFTQVDDPAEAQSVAQFTMNEFVVEKGSQIMRLSLFSPPPPPEKGKSPATGLRFVSAGSSETGYEQSVKKVVTRFQEMYRNGTLELIPTADPSGLLRRGIRSSAEAVGFSTAVLGTCLTTLGGCLAFGPNTGNVANDKGAIGVTFLILGGLATVSLSGVALAGLARHDLAKAHAANMAQQILTLFALRPDTSVFNVVVLVSKSGDPTANASGFFKMVARNLRANKTLVTAETTVAFK